MKRTVLGYSWGLAIAVCGAAAAEEKEGHGSRAAELFQQGRDEMRTGDYEAACRHFAESHRLDAAVGTLLNEAICQERTGHLLRSRELVRAFVRSASPTDDRTPRAVGLAANLDERIPTLTIEVRSNLPVDAALFLDGKTIPHEKWNVAVAVEPGDHDVTFRAAGFAEWKTHVALAELQRMTIVVTPSPLAADVAAPREAEPAAIDRPSEALSPWFWGTAFLGAAGLATAATSGVMVLVNRQTVDQRCVNKICDPEGIAAGERGTAWAMTSTISLPIGIVGTAFATYLFTSHRSAAAPVNTVGLRVDRSASTIVIGGDF